MRHFWSSLNLHPLWVTLYFGYKVVKCKPLPNTLKMEPRFFSILKALGSPITIILWVVTRRVFPAWFELTKYWKFRVALYFLFYLKLEINEKYCQTEFFFFPKWSICNYVYPPNIPFNQDVECIFLLHWFSFVLINPLFITTLLRDVSVTCKRVRNFINVLTVLTN